MLDIDPALVAIDSPLPHAADTPLTQLNGGNDSAHTDTKPAGADPGAGASAAGTALETDPAAPKKTRSKDGCLVCRSRRIKCDTGASNPASA
jgi:hypothetical protein